MNETQKDNDLIEGVDQNNNIGSYFKEKEQCMSSLGKINIAKKDVDILNNSNEWLNYSKAVFNNKRNYKKYKTIVVSTIIQFILLVTGIVSVIVNIPFAINKEFNNVAFFSIGASCLVILFFIFLGIFHDYRGWYLGQSSLVESNKKIMPIYYFFGEYLKSKFEVINNIKPSQERIEQIKQNYISIYYKLHEKQESDFENNNKKISNKINETNYVSKYDKVMKLLNVFNWTYDFLSILIVVSMFLTILSMLNII